MVDQLEAEELRVAKEVGQRMFFIVDRILNGAEMAVAMTALTEAVYLVLVSGAPEAKLTESEMIETFCEGLLACKTDDPVQ